MFLYQPRNSRAQPRNIWKIFVNACGTKKEMTALRISSKNTRNIDKVGRKFQKIVVLQTSNSMDKILNLIYGKQVVARRT